MTIFTSSPSPQDKHLPPVQVNNLLSYFIWAYLGSPKLTESEEVRGWSKTLLGKMTTSKHLQNNLTLQIYYCWCHGGYASTSICLSVCKQHYYKSYEWILMEIAYNPFISCWIMLLAGRQTDWFQQMLAIGLLFKQLHVDFVEFFINCSLYHCRAILKISVWFWFNINHSQTNKLWRKVLLIFRNRNHALSYLWKWNFATFGLQNRHTNHLRYSGCIYQLLFGLPKLPSQCYSYGLVNLGNLGSNKEIQPQRILSRKCCP